MTTDPKQVGEAVERLAAFGVAMGECSLNWAVTCVYGDGLQAATGRLAKDIAALSTLRSQHEALVGAIEELDEGIQSALSSQEQDVKVNGARHPGLLQPMRDILRDIIAPRSTALRQALNPTQPND